MPSRLVARTVVVQVAPDMFGASHEAKKKPVPLASGRGPTQSSVMVTDPGCPSSQNTWPTIDSWLPVWNGPQSAGDAELPNTQAKLVSWNPATGCGGRAVAAVPGWVSTAAVTVVARPSPLTACAVRKHRPPPTGGSQNPLTPSIPRDEVPNRPPQLSDTSNVPGVLPPQLNTDTL